LANKVLFCRRSHGSPAGSKKYVKKLFFKKARKKVAILKVQQSFCDLFQKDPNYHAVIHHDN
jgi:hypothetical protein